MRLALFLTLAASPVVADGALSLEDFIERFAGRTTVINVPGEEPYGIEAYLPDNRVSWGFLNTGECLDGTYFETTPGTICFSYDDGEDVLHCWRHFERNGVILAQQTNEDGIPDPVPAYRIEITDRSLPCVEEFLGS